MRRFSFKIDLTQQNGPSSVPQKRSNASSAPKQADGFEMSSSLQEQRQALREWPRFQAHLEALPKLIETLEPWADPNLGAEFVRIYRVSAQKVLDSAPGFYQEEKTENHCFFSSDGTKHVLSRLLARPHDRVSEIRLTPQGTLIRLYYEKSSGPAQSLEDLFEHGLLGLDEDLSRFTRYPHYVLRFFLLNPKDEYLESSFRGVSYFDEDTRQIITEEAASL